MRYFLKVKFEFQDDVSFLGQYIWFRLLRSDVLVLVSSQES